MGGGTGQDLGRGWSPGPDPHRPDRPPGLWGRHSRNPRGAAQQRRAGGPGLGLDSRASIPRNRPSSAWLTWEMGPREAPTQASARW